MLVAYSETNGKAVSQSLRGLASQLINSISIRFTLRKPAEIRLHSPVEHSVLLALQALKLPETFAIRRQSRNRRELFSDRMVLRHCGILSRVARPMGELAVFPNRFSFFAVWNDVIDRGVFEGKNLIMAKCTDRIQNRRSLPSQTQRTANNRR